MSDTTVTEEELVLSAEAEEAMADKIATKLFEKQEAQKEATEAVVTKDVGGDASESSEDENVEVSEGATEAKEIRFVKGIKALMSGNHKSLSELNAVSIGEMEPKLKYGFQNETTNADGGYLVPPADFIADVARLEQEYGVALRDARIIRTNSNTVLLNKKASGVSLYEMTSNNDPTGSVGVGSAGETQKKRGTKMTFGQDSITLRKFAAIAAVSDELLEDAAVNIYNEIVTDFARANARQADILVFTDSSSGIINTSGVVSISSGTVLDQMVQATWQVPTDSAKGGKFYISRSRFGGLLQAKDTTGRYILTPGADGTSGTTVWGHPYEVVEVLEETGNRNTVIFGNLQYVVLVVKNGLQLTTLREGTVWDADGNSINLAQQDMTALRAVVRMASKVQFPAAFAKLTAGTVS